MREGEKHLPTPDGTNAAKDGGTASEPTPEEINALFHTEPDEISPQTLPSRPLIQLPGNNRLLSEFATELGKVLSGVNIFRRGGIAFIPNHSNDGLCLVTPDMLRTWLEKHAVCYKRIRPFGQEQTIEVRRTATVSDAQGVLASPQFLEQLRPIERFHTIQMPAYDQNGALRLLPIGYDAFSLTFTAENTIKIVADLPMDSAKRIIDGLLAEFPFKDGKRSRAVAVGGMLTCFAPLLLPKDSLRPCFIYLANAEGAGKSLLVKCAVVPVMGRAPTGSKPRDEDEMKKLLLASVMESAGVLFLDNIKGRLASESLEGFLTSQTYSGRVLGLTKTFTGQNNVTVYITGNGCTVSPDMRRRSLFCELFMELERAEDRVFRSQLEVPELIQRRGEILSAWYAFVREWHEAGEPEPSRSHSGFPDWARKIGGIVEYAGYGCPLETPEIEAAADIDGADMRALITAICDDAAVLKSVKFEELVETARQNGLFERLIPESGIMDNKQRASLGSLLRSYDDRVVGNHRFRLEGKGHKRRFIVTKEGP